MTRKTKLLIAGGIAVALFGPWGYFFQEFIPVDAHAISECTRFVDEIKAKKDSILSGYAKTEIGKGWWKNNRQVVQINLFDKADDTTYHQRLCVVGGGEVKIVSGLENWKWGD
jgi:hypothetical protein